MSSISVSSLPFVGISHSHKHTNIIWIRYLQIMKVLLMFTTILFLLFSIIESILRPPKKVLNSQLPAEPETFSQWCELREYFPPATQHTIAVMLKSAGTNNYQLAESKLMSLAEIDLNGCQISDLRPIASLSNLNILKLDRNLISDLRPIGKLTKLVILDLSNNQIRDVTPLSNLTILGFLKLSNNRQLSDIKPLASLTTIVTLNMSGTQVKLEECPLNWKFVVFSEQVFPSVDLGRASIDLHSDR
jgi:Leucine-rich repeat (LRR) protein